VRRLARGRRVRGLPVWDGADRHPRFEPDPALEGQFEPLIDRDDPPAGAASSGQSRPPLALRPAAQAQPKRAEKTIARRMSVKERKRRCGPMEPPPSARPNLSTRQSPSPLANAPEALCLCLEPGFARELIINASASAERLTDVRPLHKLKLSAPATYRSLLPTIGFCRTVVVRLARKPLAVRARA